MTEKVEIKDFKKVHTVTVDLCYEDGSNAPDVINVRGDITVVDLLLAREAINDAIYRRTVDEQGGIPSFLATAIESYCS